jgi:hypothetical protein
MIFPALFHRRIEGLLGHENDRQWPAINISRRWSERHSLPNFTRDRWSESHSIFNLSRLLFALAP